MGLLRQTLFICFCLNISKNGAGNKDVCLDLIHGHYWGIISRK